MPRLKRREGRTWEGLLIHKSAHPRTEACNTAGASVPYKVHGKEGSGKAVNYKGRFHQKAGKRVPAIFYATEAGGEPVREWLKSLPAKERKLIGTDIMTVEFGWPVGMPVCRPLGAGIYEVRTNLPRNRIARVLFYFDKKERMVLLHGFIKKTQRTPDEDLELARNNKSKHERGMK